MPPGLTRSRTCQPGRREAGRRQQQPEAEEGEPNQGPADGYGEGVRLRLAKVRWQGNSPPLNRNRADATRGGRGLYQFGGSSIPDRDCCWIPAEGVGAVFVGAGWACDRRMRRRMRAFGGGAEAGEMPCFAVSAWGVGKARKLVCPD
jgi:hypothetical protein